MDFSNLVDTVVATEDLNKTKAFEERKPLKEGTVLLRLREYVEQGLHLPSAAAKFPKNTQKAYCVFETVGAKHCEPDADGKMIPRTIRVMFNCGTSAKSGNRKLFSAMNTASGGVYKHFVEMIGKPFKATITNSVPAKEGDAIYSNLDKGTRPDTIYTFVSLQREDDEGEPMVDANGTPVNLAVPEMHGKGKVFLWEMDGLTDEQIVEMWNSLYIEGEWEAKEAADGKPAKAARSKNTDQDKIMTNLQWAGSRTEGLTQSFVEIDELSGEPVDEPVDVPAADKPVDLAALAATPEKAPAADIPEIPEV